MQACAKICELACVYEQIVGKRPEPVGRYRRRELGSHFLKMGEVETAGCVMKRLGDSKEQRSLVSWFQGGGQAPLWSWPDRPKKDFEIKKKFIVHKDKKTSKKFSPLHGRCEKDIENMKS